MTQEGDREWRLVREESLDGPTAMAFDEIAAETAGSGGPGTVRVYRWTPSTLSLGYRQDPATVDWTYCDRRGIDVVRRPTGGGAIYHDTAGDISYSIVAPADEVPGDLLACYEYLCEPVLDAFHELGVDARLAETEAPPLHQPACYFRGVDPAHDVVAGDGRKISGNAQYRRRDAVIQHGSLTFEAKPETTLNCLADPAVTLAECRERMTSIVAQAGDLQAPSRDAAVRTLEASLAAWTGAADGTWTDEERRRAANLAAEKYATDAWNRERADPTERRHPPAPDDATVPDDATSPEEWQG